MRSNSRIEFLQQAFNAVVGPELADARANNHYTVSYQPASYENGVIRLQLHVVNQRNWSTMSANIEGTADSFIIRCGNHTAHMPDELLVQGLAAVKHGIAALRPNA